MDHITCLASAVFARHCTFHGVNILPAGGIREPATLADVFLTYSRLDHDRVQLIADRLRTLGYSVWFDPHEDGGQALFDQVEREFDEAKAVIAVWSAHARSSTFVYAEASLALDANKFLQLQLDPVTLPAPFEALPIADMSGATSEWGKLEDALNRIVRENRAPLPFERLRRRGFLATPPLAGAPKLMKIVMTIVMIGYVVALIGAYNGVITPSEMQWAMIAMLGVSGACAFFSAFLLRRLRRAGG